MTDTDLRVTVLIPTHNPRPTVLARVLTALAAQTLSRKQWRTVIIDNGSTPAIAATQWTEYLSDVEVVRENRLGLTHSRLAGLRAARSAAIVFVDDDNLLAPDYLERALEFLDLHPEVGVVGGRIVGEFATVPPPWAEPHLGSLALRDLGTTEIISNHRGAVTEYDYFAPFGAGMVIRSAISAAYVSACAAGDIGAVDRTGRQLGGCGDCEIVIVAWKSGYECAYVPRLKLTHVIPASRLTFLYLQRLAREGQQSWGDFLRRHGLTRPLPRWTVPIRQAKAFVRHRAWTRGGFIAWRGACGFFVGAAGPKPQSTPSSASRPMQPQS
jgi:glycosyltransferase involved in cell wall biosynthesis